MSEYLLNWTGLLVRWIHLIAGIAWIGSSFYLARVQSRSPANEPADGPTVHWFSWQAYSTWLSGMGLLGLLYFLRPDAYLIDPAVRRLPRSAAVAIALAVLIGSWLAYDRLCRSRLGRSNFKLTVALALLASAVAGGLSVLFSGRGAFILFGSALGTIMVANILFVIAPGRGPQGGQRAMHNSYLTLPVLFVMFTIHDAMTYGGPHNALVLIAMTFSGVCIRAGFVARHKPGGHRTFDSLMLLILGLLALLIVIVGLYPNAATPV